MRIKDSLFNLNFLFGVFLTMIIAMTSFFCKPVTAAITGAAGFSVALSGGQSTSNNDNFFILNLQPGQSQQVNLKITNNLDKKIRVAVLPTVAGTTNQGQLDYANLSSKRDSSLQHDWTKMGPQKVTISLPPKSAQTVTQTITAPKKSFNGVMLGSFYIHSPSIDKQNAAKKLKHSGVNNLYAYSISILMNCGAVEQVQPDLRLRSIRPGVLEAGPAVFINIQNFKAKYINKNAMRIRARIYPAHSQKLLYQSKIKNGNFAPNSNFSFPVSWNHHPMKAGNYQARVQVSAQARSWNLVKNFTISPAEARKLNRNDPNIKPNYWPLILVLIIVVLLLIALLFYWFYKHGQRQATQMKR